VNASPWPLTMFVSILTVAFGTAPALEASVTIVATAHRDRAPRKGSGTPSGPCIASAGVGATGLLGAAVTQRYNCSYSMRGTWADRGNARPRMQQKQRSLFCVCFFSKVNLEIRTKPSEKRTTGRQTGGLTTKGVPHHPQAKVGRNKGATWCWCAPIRRRSDTHVAPLPRPTPKDGGRVIQPQESA